MELWLESPCVELVLQIVFDALHSVQFAVDTWDTRGIENGRATPHAGIGFGFLANL